MTTGQVKRSLHSLLLLSAGFVITSCSTFSQSQSSSPVEEAEIQNLRDSGSYVLGQELGREARDLKTEYDANDTLLLKGLRDALLDSSTKIPRKMSDRIFELYEEQMKRERAQESESSVESDDKKKESIAQRNKEKSKAFLKQNMAREGVSRTSSGLQYKVLEKGNGPSPGPDDKVKVHYKGKLIDGTVFDNSYERGGPATFQVGGVIKGWQEGLQLMKAGSKYRLYIPPRLAYGQGGAGEKIGPNETLIFTVELLEVM